MAGTKEGGKKAAQKLLARDPLWFKKIAAKGGLKPTDKPKGFAVMTLEDRTKAAIKGGRNGRRTPDGRN